MNNYLTPTRLVDLMSSRDFLCNFFLFLFFLRFLFLSSLILSKACADTNFVSCWETFSLETVTGEVFGCELFPPCVSNKVDHPLLFATCRP